MADENNTGSITPPVGADAELKAPPVKKQKSLSRQKVAAKPAQAVPTAAAVKATSTRAKRYNDKRKSKSSS